MSATHFNFKKPILLAVLWGIGLIAGASAQAEENNQTPPVSPSEIKKRVTNDYYIKIIEKQNKLTPATVPIVDTEKKSKEI